jgi:hypothetical protein
MPDSRIVEIHKKIVDLTAVNYAAGYSGFDMTGRVIRGSTIDPPYQPFCCVSFEQALQNYGPTLRDFNYEAEYHLFIFVGGSTLDQRFDNATNLSSDMIEALTANRQLGLPGKVDDIICSFTAIDGSKYGLDNIGIGYISVSVKCVTSTGA